VTFAAGVRVVKNVLVPMRDGVHLACEVPEFGACPKKSAIFAGRTLIWHPTPRPPLANLWGVKIQGRVPGNGGLQAESGV
jgi:hypothetical protein